MMLKNDSFLFNVIALAIMMILLINSVVLCQQLPQVQTTWIKTLSFLSTASFTTPYISPANDILVVGSTTENIVAALNTSDGVLLWSTSIAGRVSRSPTIFCANNTDTHTCVVLVGSNTAAAMYVFNATTGSSIATRSVARVIDTSPGAVVDSTTSPQNLLTCFGSTQDFTIWGDNLTLFSGSGTGGGSTASLWSKTMGARPTSSCLPVNGNSFAIGASGGDFFLLDAKTGAQKWKYFLGTTVAAPPVLFSDPTFGQIIILATASGNIVVLRVSDGSLVYSVLASRAANGLTSVNVHPDARMVISGDQDGGVQGLSLVTGTVVFRRSLTTLSIASLVPITLTPSQKTMAKNLLGVTSSTLPLIAGAANKGLFVLYVTDTAVKVVFLYSTTVSFASGGIATNPSISDCIFATQTGQVTCLNATNIISQVDPSRYDSSASSDGGLSSAAQIAIVVTCAVVGSIIAGIVVVYCVLACRKARQEEKVRTEQQRVAEVEFGEAQAREARIRRHEMEIQEQERVRRIVVQEDDRRNAVINNNNNHQYQRAATRIAPTGNNNNNDNNAGIFETFPSSNNNNKNNNNQNFSRSSYEQSQQAEDDNVELARIVAQNNNNNNGAGNNASVVAIANSAAATTTTLAARLQLPIFTNRLEMLAAKTEQSPAAEVDLFTVRYLTQDFSIPLQSRNISELRRVVCPALGVDVLEVYLGAFVFAGRHCDLLICKTVIASHHNHNKNKTESKNKNDDDDDDGDDENHHVRNNSTSLRIPPTLHCVLGHVRAVKEINWIILDTELLLNASQANPLSEPIFSASPHNVVNNNNNNNSISLAKVFENQKQQVSNKIYTCSVCFDTVEVHRAPQQTSLIMGSLCSAFSVTSHNKNDNNPPHFTCGTCLSGSVEQLLDKGDTSLQLLPCYHPSCVENRNRTKTKNNSNGIAGLDTDDDTSGYFIFDDFSSVLKSATLRRWQKVSTEAGRTLGQKEVINALPAKKNRSKNSNHGNDDENGNNNNDDDDEATQRTNQHCARIRGLLRPRCPQCGLEFMAFTGCVSVTCEVRGGKSGTERVAGCGRNFCGACMEPFPCSGGHGHDFMNPNQIQRAWQNWRNRRVNVYLADHFSDWRNNEGARLMLERVLRTSVSDLLEAGIWPLQAPWGDVIPK